MTDVFVSYARADEPLAIRVADALRSEGYRVWRDDELPAHGTYADVIEDRLRSAAAVVVLWSSAAAKSQWVRAEADAARNAGTLVQVTVDGSSPPLPFNQIQCADLSGGIGDSTAPGWRKLNTSVAALAGRRDVVQNSAVEIAHRERSICVLPFQNMSGEAEQEYFSDGISEDITTDLSKVSALSVTARNTAFQFKGKALDVSNVAQKLGVCHVLEGSVRKAGNRVRITAQLIDGRTGDHIWAERYDRELTDIFAIQDEISKAIVEALKLKLLPAEKKAIEHHGTVCVEAYDLYLMARNLWATGNHGDLHREDRVIKVCERALKIDPDYADAWALLAIAQSSRHHAFGKRGEDGAVAAAKALALNPSLAEAYCPIIRRHIEARDFEEAEAALEQALAAGSDSWEVHHEGVRLYVRQRKFEESTYHLRKRVSAMDSDYYGWGMLLSYEWALGNMEAVREVAGKALAEAEQALARDANNGAALSVAARALACLDQRDRAIELIERGQMLDSDNLNMLYNFGATYATQLDDKEAGIALVCPAIAKASGTLISWAEIDPDVDVLRDDPRFQKVVADGLARIEARNRAETA